MHSIRTFLGLALACLAGAASAQHPDAVAPMAGMAVGKVKVLSLAQLDPATRAVAEQDLGLQQRFAKSGELETVPDEAAHIKTHYASRALYGAESKIRSQLKSDWTDLSRSELQHYRYEAFIPEGPSKAGPWSRYTRVFTRPDGVLLMLHEWDYVQDGGGVVVVQELMNARVRGHLARVVARKTRSGQHFAELTWATERKYYTLTVWDRLAPQGQGPYDRDWLIALAGRISGPGAGQ